jgi:hypothetical protein
VRLCSRLFALMFSLAAFGSTAAQASDIQCENTLQAAESVICDHAILIASTTESTSSSRTC